MLLSRQSCVYRSHPLFSDNEIEATATVKTSTAETVIPVVEDPPDLTTHAFTWEDAVDADIKFFSLAFRRNAVRRYVYSPLLAIARDSPLVYSEMSTAER